MDQFDALVTAIHQLADRVAELEAKADVHMIVIGNALPAAAKHPETAARSQAALDVAEEALTSTQRPAYRETAAAEIRRCRGALQVGVNTLPPGSR